MSSVILKKKDRVKNFEDLRGCKWAVNNIKSLSGNIIPLLSMKLLGESASFFGHLLYSGSHLKSIEMVLNKQADAAAVDSNSLAMYLSRNPQHASEIYCVESWGPLPPYPILINKRLSESLKNEIESSLLHMHKSDIWRAKLLQFGIRRFDKVPSMVYKKQKEALDSMNGLSITPAYY